MKFENIQNVEKLFQIIRDECTGTVELVSTEGDRINLKIKTVPIYFHGTVCWMAEFVRELRLVASDPADVQALIAFYAGWRIENGWEMLDFHD